ncbi:hypothetical protein Hte_000270 [Hypoxylon texense]
MGLWNLRKSGKTPSVNKEYGNEISKNFLKVLVDPPESAVDIVAVHGLNPLGKQLHAEATWTADGKLWLRDFLPKRIPNARILLFGYNSNVAFQASTAGVTEQAENLLNQVEAVRTALVHSKSDKTYEAIQKSTFGIVFFSTPHRGGNHAEVGDVVAKIARSMLGTPSNNFIDALKNNSAMNTITSDFRQLLEEFQFLTFYETQPLGCFGVVVTQDSAILGLPGTREKQIPLDSNHRQICKFATDEDPRYHQVADNIAKMVNDACSCRKQSVHLEKDEYNFDEIKSNSKRNVSGIWGRRNTTVQLGNANWSKTHGDTNKTQQFGNRNLSVQNGDGNQTIQFATDPTDLWRFMEMLLLGTKYLFTPAFVKGQI